MSAFRKGRQHGTILVDLERHQPIALLADRCIGDVGRLVGSTSWSGSAGTRPLKSL